MLVAVKLHLDKDEAYPWKRVMLMWDQFGRGDGYAQFKTLRWHTFEKLSSSSKKRKSDEIIDVPSGTAFGDISE